jgi:conjugative transfer region protein (TIGR03750 family)
MKEDDDFLADRVDYEPAVFKGVSSSEFFSLCTLAASVMVPTTIVLAVFFRSVIVLIALPVGTFAIVYFGALMMTVRKRNRPQAYYEHSIHKLLVDHHVGRAKFILRSGRWLLSRGNPY